MGVTTEHVSITGYSVEEAEEKIGKMIEQVKALYFLKKFRESFNAFVDAEQTFLRTAQVMKEVLEEIVPQSTS